MLTKQVQTTFLPPVKNFLFQVYLIKFYEINLLHISSLETSIKQTLQTLHECSQ